MAYLATPINCDIQLTVGTSAIQESHTYLMLIKITPSAIDPENIVKVQPIPIARTVGEIAAVPPAPSKQRTTFKAAVAEALRSG